jgi:hypothetical protein
MKNKLFFMGILVMALLFGTIVVGCDNGSTDDSNASNGSGGTDPALIGTWVAEDGYELKFNKGSFESFADGTIYEKGTYTTNGGTITTQRTQSSSGSWGLADGRTLQMGPELYTKDQQKTAVEKRLKEMGLTGMELSDACEWIFDSIDEDFLPHIGIYVVEGNTLILRLYFGNYGYTFILTRK